MKKGIKVLCNGVVGTSLGLIERYGTKWVLVEYPDGSRAIAREEILEVINGTED